MANRGRTPRARWPVLAALAGAAIAAGLTASVIAEPGARDGPSQYDAQLAFLRDQLALAQSQEDRANLEGKIAELDENRTSEIEGRDAELDPTFPERAKEKREALLDEAEANDAAGLAHAEWVPAGAGFMVEDARPFEHPSTFVAENDWFVELEPRELLVVWAGRDGADPAQGVIRVWREGPAETALKAVIVVPGSRGPVRITGADDWTLQLVSADGTMHEFDARTFELR